MFPDVIGLLKAVGFGVVGGSALVLGTAGALGELPSPDSHQALLGAILAFLGGLWREQRTMNNQVSAGAPVPPDIHAKLDTIAGGVTDCQKSIAVLSERVENRAKESDRRFLEQTERVNRLSDEIKRPKLTS